MVNPALLTILLPYGIKIAKQIMNNINHQPTPEELKAIEEMINEQAKMYVAEMEDNNDYFDTVIENEDEKPSG